MRVAVVTTSYPTEPGAPAGWFVAEHARALAGDGHEVVVIAAGGTASRLEGVEGDVLDGVSVCWTGGAALFGWPGAAARLRRRPWRMAVCAPAAARARALLSARGPFDRVVAHWLVPTAWPLLVGRTEPLHVVGHGGDVRLLLALPRPLRAAVVQWLLRRAERIDLSAAALLDALADALPAPLAEALRQTARVQPPPLALPEDAAWRQAAASARASLGVVPGERLVVTVGRLVTSKRPELAVRAVAALPRARLVIVGDGPLRPHLERLALACGVRCTFLGRLPRGEALAVIAAGDALVHPSAAEGAPTAVREARAAGVPVVATAAGDLLRWAAHDGGIRVVAADPRALASALEEAMRTTACPTASSLVAPSPEGIR